MMTAGEPGQGDADRLSRDFFQAPVEEVARNLLGQELVSRYNGCRTSGIVVETEAYLGTSDSASHVFGGRRTKRTEALYRAGGHAYVYLIYGLHWCLNITTGPPEEPTCVLIRALEPVYGIETIRRRRSVKDERRLADGPGKLCQALAIDGRSNGADLGGDELFFLWRGMSDFQVEQSPRIGIDYARPQDRDRPCRYFIAGHPNVSRARRR